MRCRPLLASIAVGLFAGLRTGELAVLEWENIHLIGSQRFIEVAARKAKTRQRRIVSISDNLAAWLMPVAQVTGPVVPAAYRERHERLHSCSRNSPLGLETCSATPRLLSPRVPQKRALDRSRNGQFSGRDFQHYRALVTPEAAQKFWKLYPATDVDAEKLVGFAA